MSQEFVVKINETTKLYMISYNTEYSRCQWGNVNDAVIFDTLEEAEAIATGINSGTVGTPKPK